MRLAWDRTGERFYETGVDQGVLYLPDGSGNYNEGHAWNGLTTVTETPAGAESNKQYADNIAYLNLLSAETFGGTIEAFTYPDEFGQCDGTVEPQPGVSLGQQGRRPLPDEVIAIFGTGVVDVDLNVAANQPTFNNATGVVTIPAVAGVVFQVNGEDVAAGAQPAIAIGDTAIVEARAADTNHNLVGDEDWAFERTA
jgi:hypothetical protein